MDSPANLELLGKLFADEDASFRHRMGLSRSDPEAFYGTTAEGAAIRSEKEAILRSPAAGLHLVETVEGFAAFAEFAALMGQTFPADPHSRNVALTESLEPDWLLLAPSDWTLVWASVCFPTRWSLAGKASRPLTEIHGVVPKLNEELGRKIHVFFDRLNPGEGWSRANWGLSSNAQRNQHPRLPYAPISDQTPASAIYLRIESQHLMKLAGTGAVAFGIRIRSVPLTEVLNHPVIAAGLREQLRTMPAEMADYKGIRAISGSAAGRLRQTLSAS